MNINIQNNNEFLKSEFIDQANVLGVKVYNEDAVLGLINVQKGLIEKAERAELNEEEKSQLDVCKAELQSIKKVVLVNDELEKENWFIRTGKGADIEKSKKAGVGEIHEWNGKRYRKEATGKWVEVSEHGMNKKEHEMEKEKHEMNLGKTVKNKEFFGDKYDTIISNANKEKEKHSNSSSKLSDKEHTDEEVGLGKKEESKPKSEGKEKEGGYNADEWNITEPKEVLKRTKEVNDLKAKRARYTEDSYAYKVLDKQIKQFEKMRITDKDGNTVGWKKFDDED